MLMCALLLSVPLACLLIGVSLLVRRNWQQCSLRAIPGPDTDSFFTGNLKQFLGPAALPFQDDMTRTYGGIFRLHGLLGEQILVVSDPAALQHIMCKRMEVFQPAQYWLELARMYFGRGLLSVTGEVHKRQRKLMHPAFSFAQMKRTVPLFHAVARELVEVTIGDVDTAPIGELDVLDYMSRASIESIARGGFGQTLGALRSGASEFGAAIKRLAPAGAKTAVYRPLLPLLTRLLPPVLLRRAALALPWPALHEQIEISDTLDRHARQIWNERTSLSDPGLDGNDRRRSVLSILLDENEKASTQERLSDDQLLGQIVAFMFAGTDTSANVLSRILHILAERPDVQDALRGELVEAGAESAELEVEALDHLPLLDAVIRETLRVFPPIRFLQRVSGADYVLPISHKQPGCLASEVFVPAGTTIIVNIAAANCDEAVWGADAAQWCPQRWLVPCLPDVAKTRIPGVYGNMMSFSGGSRSCVGYKFSLLQMKTVLSHWVTSFAFKPSKRKIHWKFGGIVTPAVVGEAPDKPELPLRVTRVAHC